MKNLIFNEAFSLLYLVKTPYMIKGVNRYKFMLCTLLV